MRSLSPIPFESFQQKQFYKLILESILKKQQQQTTKNKMHGSEWFYCFKKEEMYFWYQFIQNL